MAKNVLTESFNGDIHTVNPYNVAEGLEKAGAIYEDSLILPTDRYSDELPVFIGLTATGLVFDVVELEGPACVVSLWIVVYTYTRQ